MPLRNRQDDCAPDRRALYHLQMVNLGLLAQRDIRCVPSIRVDTAAAYPCDGQRATCIRHRTQMDRRIGFQTDPVKGLLDGSE